MPILKQRPDELAIHGGGPPAFDRRIASFTPHVGDSTLFGRLAERMFLAGESAGTLVAEFEKEIAEFVGVGNAIGFSSPVSAIRCVTRALRGRSTPWIDAMGNGLLDCDELKDAEVGDLLPPTSDSPRLVVTSHLFGSLIDAPGIESWATEQGHTLCFLGQTAFASRLGSQTAGQLGRLTIFDLGRDQVLHANDAAVVLTDDDLVAHRLRIARSSKLDGLSPAMGDAAAAMGLANLPATEAFLSSDKERFQVYREIMQDVPGIRLLSPPHQGWNYRAVALEIDPGESGISRDSLYDILTSENVGSTKPFEADYCLRDTPQANRRRERLLLLPQGPGLTDEDIQAICRIVQLAVVEGLESPDPLALAA